MQGLGIKPVFVLLLATTILAGCQDSDAQAEAHYQRALELLEDGDFARARVEFLNVFQENGFHREARSEFAAMLRSQGDTGQSYSQYLRLVEQYPEDVPGRIALAEMSLQFQNWEEAERHGERAIELAPEDPAVPVIQVSLNYVAATLEDDEAARDEALGQARVLLAEAPDNILLRRLVIDDALREGDLEGALAEIDRLLEQEPENRDLHNTRLGLFVELNQVEQFEDQLLRMLEIFPGDEDLQTTYLRLLLSERRIEDAETYMRSLAETAETARDRRDTLVALVRLKLQSQGADAALAELEGLIASEEDFLATYRALRASLRFEAGERDAAIAEMEELLTGDLSLTERGNIQVSLARMLLDSGNVVGARAQVEEVLEDDPSQVDALKMRAAWLIEEDEADRAIAALRIALDVAPDDPDALVLMSEAYSRNGNRELAREFLALATEASNADPEVSLRYAGLLLENDGTLAAEEVLIDALRLAPQNLALLSALGELYGENQDWPRMEGVERRLRELSEPNAMRLADGLQATRLASQGRVDEAVSFLEDLAAGAEDGDLGVQVAVIRARLANNDVEGAMSYAQELLAANPDSLPLLAVLANVQNATGDFAEAEASFTRLTEAAPQAQQAWIGLIRSRTAQGDTAGAEAALNEALEVLPDALDLLWAQASFLERSGDIEGAIATYEQMYERAPNSPVVANNLASLISAYRDSDEDLERAYNVARRLRGSDLPAFQDTYGWIAYRRGDLDEALEHLEPAAAGLPGDALVQYHLGMTLSALGRTGDAIEQLRRALDIAGPEDTREQFEIARTEIARLEAAEASEAAEEGAVSE